MSIWFDRAEVRLCELHNDGHSASQIAGLLYEEFGLRTTRNAVTGKLWRMGLSAPVVKKPPTPRMPRKPRRLCNPINNFRGAPPETEHQPFEYVTMLSPDDIPLHQRKSFFQLESHHCRFPYGDPGNEDFFFCGGTIKKDQSYCVMHCRIAYNGRPAVKGRVGYNYGTRAA